MPFLLMGLNHKSAPVEVREKISYEGESLRDILQSLQSHPGIHESVVISTCNRSEFYCYADNDSAIEDWFQAHPDYHHEIASHLYTHDNEAAVKHLFRVASGLDSLVLGEPQILGQLKNAYQVSRDNQSVGYNLQRIFEQAFSCAKYVRSETQIGANPISVAYAAVRLSQQIFGDLEKRHVLLIGAGETNELVARHFHANDIGMMTIANRNVAKAILLSNQFGGKGIGISDIPKALIDADIIISSTAAPLPILGKGMVETALKARKHRPFFMVDIAVPRDIEPEVGQLEDVYLYTVDDLESVIEENRQSREAAASEAESIIDEKTLAYSEWQRSLDANDTIQSLRQHISLQADETLKKAQKMIEQGKSADEVLQFYQHTLTNKILHTPTVQLREAATDGDHALLDATKQLFDI